MISVPSLRKFDLLKYFGHYATTWIACVIDSQSVTDDQCRSSRKVLAHFECRCVDRRATILDVC